MTRVTAYIEGAGKRKLRRIFVTKDKVAGVCLSHLPEDGRVSRKILCDLKLRVLCCLYRNLLSIIYTFENATSYVLFPYLLIWSSISEDLDD